VKEKEEKKEGKTGKDHDNITAYTGTKLRTAISCSPWFV
jgi:hypothetical protein